MDMQNTTTDMAKEIKSTASDASSFVDEVADQFPEVVEKLEDIGGNIVEHLKSNRTTYLAVTVGAVVLGGAFLLFNTLKAKRPQLARVAPRLTGTRAKRKQSRVH